MSESQNEARLVELETRQAFLDDTLASLNEALVNQQRRILQLEQMLELLIERVRAPAVDLGPAVDEPPPPHY